MEQWEFTETTVTLSNREWNDLLIYLYMTSNHRKGELEACKSLAKEKDEQGNIKYPIMKSNAEFWNEMGTTIEDIIQQIENRTRV